MATAERSKDKSHENRFNNRFSREPVYGENVRTYEEEGRALIELKASLESGAVNLVGSSIIGKEVGDAIEAKLLELHQAELLGASVFCGEGIELITEDGGLLVIGDDCIIYNSIIKVARGCVLMLESATILGSNITISSGEHRIINTNLSRCSIINSTLNDVESKDSDIDSSLIRDAHFKSSTIKICIGSVGGSEIGGVFINKSFSYYLQPELGKIEVKIDDLEDVNLSVDK
jgi:hypothetical protein